MAGQQIRISKAEGRCIVRALGAIIGESDNALILREGDFPEITFVPREDITMAFLDVSETKSACPHKGKATHFDFVGTNRTLKDIAVSYDKATGSAGVIAGYLTFDESLAAIDHIT